MTAPVPASEYARLTDYITATQTSPRIPRPSPCTPKRYPKASLSMSPHDASDKDDDQMSVAGTVFNEPWDSGVLDNLMDLANYGDCLDEPIAEEDAMNRLSTMTITNNDSQQPVSQSYDSQPVNQSSSYAVIDLSANHHSTPVNSNGQRDANANFTTQQHQYQNIDVTPIGHHQDCCKTVSNGCSTSAGSSTTSSPPLSHQSKAASINDCYIDDGPQTADSQSVDQPVVSQRIRASHRIHEYIARLACNEHTVFGRTIQQFIRCTVEAIDHDPYVQLRNVRQFMNGMKNYLVKHGEADLHEIIERERSKLSAEEFLNIDMILEETMHEIVLGNRLMKPHLYHLLMKEQSKSGALAVIANNITQLRNANNELLWGSSDKPAPPPNVLECVRSHLRKMQHQTSPLKKLHHLLTAVSLMNSRSDTQGKNVPKADDLVQTMVYMLVKCSVVGCEWEASYMWDLLPQPILTGHASYYLTALFSAIHVIKTADPAQYNCSTPVNDTPNQSIGLKSTNSSMSVASAAAQSASWNQAFLKVAVPDEVHGCIRYHTLPAGHQMSTAKVCRLIAHQFAITNPEDHGLYLLFEDGFETLLLAADVPEQIRDQLVIRNKGYMFAYKRHDAKIAWPKVAMNC